MRAAAVALEVARLHAASNARPINSLELFATHVDELPKLHEDTLRATVLEHDLARDQVQLADLRVEGLRAKQRFFERALNCMQDISSLNFTYLPTAN